MTQSFDIQITGTEKGTRGKNKWNLRNDVGGKLTLAQLREFANEALVSIAEDVLKEEQKKGFPKKFIQITDGKVGKPYQLVDINKKGRIQFTTSQSVFEVVDFIFKFIEQKSPVLTGRYRNSNVLFYNRKLVARNLAEATKWAKNASVEQFDTLQFINFQPYARKLEREGITQGNINPRVGKNRSSKSIFNNVSLKPNGTYYLTSLAARSRFSKAVGRIKFEFIQGEAAYQNLSTIQRKTFKEDGRPYLYPSIILTIDTRGVS